MIFGYGFFKNGVITAYTALILLPFQNRLVCFTYFNIYSTWPHDMTYISRKQLASVAIATIFRFILQ